MNSRNFLNYFNLKFQMLKNLKKDFKENTLDSN